MSTETDPILPFSRLDWQGDGHAHLTEPGALSAEALGAVLAHVVRHVAVEAASSAVEPVSLTQDVTAGLEAGSPVSFATAIDRRTRTLVFASGRAAQGERVVMTLTGVFRIVGSSAQA